METILALAIGLACLITPMAIIVIAVFMELAGGENDWRDQSDLERIERGPPKRWAQPGVPAVTEAPCHGCAIGIHASCDANCDCDCPWPYTPTRRATIGR